MTLPGVFIHMVKPGKGAGKWHLGRAICGCNISSYTPQTREPSKATCPRCIASIKKQGLAS